MIAQASIDAWVEEDHPNANHAETAKLWLNGGAGSDTRYAYVFIPRPFPFGVTVSEATLRVYLNGTWASTQTITAKRITESWKEGQIAWSGRPATTSTNQATSASIASGSDGDAVTFDLTNMMGDVSGGADWYGVRLELSTDANRALYSTESGQSEYRPTLEIEWSAAPQAPTNLAPSGGRAASVASPILTWQFTDDAGSTVQSSSQVQISTSTDFSSPAYDSAKEANTVSSWNLSGEYTVTESAVRYWRVKVWDFSDLESEWSDAQAFTYEALGSLSITNPPAPAANQVEETTPPISWTLSSATQEAYELSLLRVDTPFNELLYRVPRVASTATSHAIPPGYIVQGQTYYVILRVWDDEDRQALTGAPDYVALSREFTFTPGGASAPASPDTLTATATGAKVLLHWTRAGSTPDYFALIVEGEEVEDRIDPADTLVSANTWEFDYWGPQPRVEKTYEIAAVVDDGGVLYQSTTNPDDDATTNPGKIWLIDPDDSTYVTIAGIEGVGDLTIGESAATFDLISSRAPVRITDQVRGYEGSISGSLLSKADRDTFLDLKGRLKTLRLVVGDLNLPVDLGEVSTTPTPYPGDRVYECSFAFTQAGDFTFDVAGT